MGFDQKKNGVWDCVDFKSASLTKITSGQALIFLVEKSSV